MKGVLVQSTRQFVGVLKDTLCSGRGTLERADGNLIQRERKQK